MTCVISNCRKSTPAFEPFCREHRGNEVHRLADERLQARTIIRNLLAEFVEPYEEGYASAQAARAYLESVA